MYLPAAGSDTDRPVSEAKVVVMFVTSAVRALFSSSSWYGSEAHAVAPLPIFRRWVSVS